VGAFSHKFSVSPSGETTNRIKKVRGCKNGTDLLHHHAKYGGDRRSRAGCRRKSVMFFYRQHRPARSAAMPVLFLLSGPKMGFSPRTGPQGRHVSPINVKFGCGPLPHAKFHVYRGKKVGIQPPNCQIF